MPCRMLAIEKIDGLHKIRTQYYSAVGRHLLNLQEVLLEIKFYSLITILCLEGSCCLIGTCLCKHILAAIDVVALCLCSLIVQFLLNPFRPDKAFLRVQELDV